MDVGRDLVSAGEDPDGRRVAMLSGGMSSFRVEAKEHRRMADAAMTTRRITQLSAGIYKKQAFQTSRWVGDWAGVCVCGLVGWWVGGWTGERVRGGEWVG